MAFSFNLPVFSGAAVHAYVILVMPPDTLSVKFLNSCVIIQNCCKITVDWSWGCTVLFGGEMFVLLLVKVDLL